MVLHIKKLEISSWWMPGLETAEKEKLPVCPLYDYCRLQPQGYLSSNRQGKNLWRGTAILWNSVSV